MFEETRIIGDYSVITSIRIGKYEIALCENDEAPNDERYLCGYIENNGINVKKVFDISQTSSENFNMHRRKPDERAAIKALIASAPCDIKMVDELKVSNARYSPDKNTIFIVKGLDADEIFRSLAFEIGIAKCAEKDIDRKDGMFPSYCASYILCERNGFDTGNFNFEKVPERFADADVKDIRKSLNSIRDMSNEISQDMNRHFEAMDKANRSKDNGAR